jgi:serine/threonine protein kinase
MFVDGQQVRVMTSLRHPNVVLFMAASTKAPKMCIVMEYMALGSLFDVRTPFGRSLTCAIQKTNPPGGGALQLLHNELIPDIPFILKAKMAYQASKGMHFLHSSGTALFFFVLRSSRSVHLVVVFVDTTHTNGVHCT